MGTAQATSFAQLLKRYRLAAGLTQEGLAERANLSARAVSDLERGIKTRPYRDTVDMLADALELGPDDRSALHATVERRRSRIETTPPEETGDVTPAPAEAPAAWALRLRSHPLVSVALAVAALLIAVVALALSRNNSAAGTPRLTANISLTFDRLLTMNAAGRAQSTFHAGSVIFVRPIWRLEHVSDTAQVTITCNLQLPGRAGQQPCPGVAAVHRADANGTHADTLLFRAPRVSPSFRLVVGVSAGSETLQKSVTIHVGGPNPEALSVLPIAGCSRVPAVGVRTTCIIAEFVTNDGDHTLSFPAGGQGVVAHLARDVRSLSFSPAAGQAGLRGSSVAWTGFQIRPGSTERAKLTVSVTPKASELGSRVALIARIDASALDKTTGKQTRASSGTLTTPGQVVQ